jgi:uncharacterized membrane protein
MNIAHFVYSFVIAEYRDYFHFLATVNNAAVTMGVKIPLTDVFSFFWIDISGRGWIYDNSIFDF